MRCCATALLLAALTGCSFIPAYQRPPLPVSAQYPATGPAGPQAADIGWRAMFT